MKSDHFGYTSPVSEISSETVRNADPFAIQQEAPAPQEEPAAKALSPRLRALDAFRGLAILLMLLVNNVALDNATPLQLTHAPWNGGVRLADFVMPWFLFAMGAAIPFSAASAKRKGVPAWKFDLRILARVAALVLLGVLVDNAVLGQQQPGKHQFVFLLGVLQIIGLAYLIASLLYDLPISRRLLIAAGMLVAYWAAIKFIPVPGIGTGVFEESRNLIDHLNRTYLNAVSLWGLPSVIPTAALAMIGSAAGEVFQQCKLTAYKRLAILLIAGAALTVLGIAWNASLPFNKGVWTPSYVLLTAGTGMALLGVLYLILDVNEWWQWSYPLLVFGSNAILAYVAPILVKTLFLRAWLTGPPAHRVSIEQWLLDGVKSHLGPIPGGWVYTLGYVVVCWAVLWLLYRKKVFLRV